jgi:hypothetical protein
MMQIELLEQQITELDDASFSTLREWFVEYDQTRWGKKWKQTPTRENLIYLLIPR